MAELHHPDLGVTITVPEGAAWVRLRNGWKYVIKPTVKKAVKPTVKKAVEPTVKSVPEDRPIEGEGN